MNLFADDAWLIDRHAPELLVLHQDSGFDYDVMDLREHDGENIAKVLYIGEPDDLKVTSANLEREFGAGETFAECPADRQQLRGGRCASTACVVRHDG